MDMWKERELQNSYILYNDVSYIDISRYTDKSSVYPSTFLLHRSLCT
jgi:hypothetical protein